MTNSAGNVQTELCARFERDALPLRDTLYRHASLWWTGPTVTYVIDAFIDQPTALLTAWPVAPPSRSFACVARPAWACVPSAATPPSTQEPQVTEKVDDRVRATGSERDSEESTPAETAVATISVDGHVHDITVSPDGEHVYVARSDSVVVINRRHHIVARIPISRSTPKAW